MAFNLADMINKRPVQPVNTENINDTVYRDVFELVPSKENFYSMIRQSEYIKIKEN